ncbi:hypothetical protein P389DRAFT_99876 [Cystobasidium minutum MCA 4210]|uniref:uncharacterized protein n=1 Tax=Cystobasidium minutum MCA 4210 TaxID=1397322 RepID=UPI0034CDE0A6|eukprot:jgi/Rhomi1/99876/CE99875_369
MTFEPETTSTYSSRSSTEVTYTFASSSAFPTSGISTQSSSTFTFVSSTASSPSFSSFVTTTSAFLTSETVAVVSASQDPLLSLSSSSSSSGTTSAIALGDQIASTSEAVDPSASAVNINGNDDGGESTSGDSGSSGGSSSRDPFLNGAGDGSGQNGKVIGGTVGGIIAAIVIVVVVVWFIGKHRRRKFVKPIVERMHTSGSGYSLPSMLNSAGSGSGTSSAGMTPSNSMSGLLAAAGSSKRRSRAFSIESASTYDKVDLNTEGPSTPNYIGRHAELAMSQVRPLRDVNNSAQRRIGDEEAQFLPAGAAPYPYRTLHRQASNGTSSVSAKNSRAAPTKYHQQIPSGSSFGSQYNDDITAQEHRERVFGSTSTGPSTLPYGSPPPSSSSPQRTFYQNTQNASPTQELLIPPSIITSRDDGVARSPFDDDDEDAYGGTDPMPHSPTLVPTQLTRRTTDPFSNRHSLRVINPDDKSREPESPTTPVASTSNASTSVPVETVPRPRAATTTSSTQKQEESGRPFSNWSSIAPSRASTLTMSDAYSTFHFDTPDGLNGDQQRFSRADSLDASRRFMRVDEHTQQQPRLELRRASSALEFVTSEGEILTPRQVNDVGFFRDA